MTVQRILGRTYARAWLGTLGTLFLLAGALGLVLPTLAGLTLDGGEMWLHLALGLVTLAVAFAVKDESTLNTIAVVFALTYLVVGLVGFVQPTIGAWRVGTLDNVLHIVVGLATLGAWSASRETEADAAGRPTM